jgi:hypothetical protein
MTQFAISTETHFRRMNQTNFDTTVVLVPVLVGLPVVLPEPLFTTQRLTSHKFIKSQIENYILQ